MLFVGIIVISILLVFSFLAVLFLINEEKIKRLNVVLYILFGVGLVSLVILFIIYYVHLNSLDSGVASAVSDAVYVVVVPALLVSLITAAFFALRHFTMKKASMLLVVLPFLSGLVIMLYTMICASWSSYKEIDLRVYMECFAMALSYVMCILPTLQLRRILELSKDEAFIKSRLGKREQRIKARLEKQRIKETKERIKKNNRRAK